MSLSSGLKLAGLDDFISPSQACIKPVEAPAKDNSRGAISIQLEDGTYSETGQDGKGKTLQAAKITLNDCLACSGCITSAESVLITQQSVDEFFTVLNDNPPVSDGGKAVIVSVSPQCWASVATHFGISGVEALSRISGLFRGLGASLILDVTSARSISLMESCAEHLHKLQNAKGPVLASACPGWVCYAEKTQHLALPYISSAKSPQQIAGTLVKGHIASSMGVPGSQIYHVSLMPCFDKKLEASRDDFTDQVTSTRDVDLVLTSAEVLEILEKKGLDFMAVQPSGLDSIWGPSQAPLTPDSPIFGQDGSSGGFAAEIFKHAAMALHGQQVVVQEPSAPSSDMEMEDASSPKVVKWKQARNSDFHELSLEMPGGQLLRVAKCNGFRNIQTIVKQLKSAKGCPYSYVEVMACPSGCVNGGGQIRVPDGAEETPKQRLAKVFETYRSSQTVRPPTEDPEAIQVYKQLLNADPYSDRARELFHTQYTARNETLLNPINIAW